MTTRSLAIAASAVVAAAVISLAYLLGAQGTGNHPATTNAPAAAPPPGSARPTDPDAGRDPVATATAWLRAYRAISWTDPAPGSWVDRVRPYIGTELAADYDRDRQGSGGAGWAPFVAGKCTSLVRDVGGVIPPKRPGHPTASTPRYRAPWSPSAPPAHRRRTNQSPRPSRCGAAPRGAGSCNDASSNAKVSCGRGSRPGAPPP
jgi:hypothetical protein